MESNVEWQKWGEIDPLYGVAAWGGKGKCEQKPWKDEEFYHFGELDWTDFIKHWEQYGVKPICCLEIGCGAGRITKHLASYFESVKAVDVSEGMVNYAKKNVQVSNIDFHVTNGLDLPFEDSSVGAVFSTDVFQHFDSLLDASSYFREINRVMDENGSLMIHLPIYSWPRLKITPVYRILYKLYTFCLATRAKCIRLLIKMGISKPFMVSQQYEIDWLYQELYKIGFREVEFRTFRITKLNTLYSFIFARKAG
jgi:ubiquinone/menaquinone biosynthesis C-methylase UbiE